MSQQLVLSEVHPLDYIPTIVEDPPDVFCVYCTCEVGVAIVSPVATCRADTLEEKQTIIKQSYLHGPNSSKGKECS